MSTVGTVSLHNNVSLISRQYKVRTPTVALTATYAAGPPTVYTVTITPAFSAATKYSVTLEPSAISTNVPYLSAKAAGSFTITGSASTFTILTADGFFGIYSLQATAPVVVNQTAA
jgi:hypothetical protein